MNRKTLICMLLGWVFALTSCNELLHGDPVKNGTLSFSEFSIELSEDLTVKSALSAATDSIALPTLEDYTLFIYDLEENLIQKISYEQIRQSDNSLTLLAGNYLLQVLSSQNPVPEAAFEQPVYGANVPITIVAGQTTTLGTVTCALMQCKVTIEYDEELLTSVTGNGRATVEVISGYPLEYALNYNGGLVEREERAGYFYVPTQSSSMVVTFLVVMNGRNEKMTKTFSGIQAAQYRKIKLIKKVNPEGTASIDVVVNGYVEDEELLSSVPVFSEDVIGEDPNAPKGDGGITLDFASDCVMYDDLSNIVVPKPSQGKMDLRLVAQVPGGVKKFTVLIESTSASFKAALATAGGAELDLINPAEAASIVFEVVPFPHGSELLGQMLIDFDLCAAQDPISNFAGEHIFHMNVTDNNGCKNTISVKMIVGE